MKKAITITCLLLCGCASGFLRDRSAGQLTACKSNLKNIATALEMYSSDNAGVYPDSWAKLTSGNYLRHVPTCPAAQKDSYTATYKFTVAKRDAKGKVIEGRDSYHFSCQGENHKAAGAGPDLPAYDSDTGLKEL